MKLWQFILLVASIVTITLLINSQCSKPTIIDHKDEIDAISDSMAVRDTIIAQLRADRDSLQKALRKPEIKYSKKVAQIDSSIKADSSNALVEFRNALQANGEIPDGTNIPSLKELGLSAKIMHKVPKLELQIKTYKEITLKDLQIQENLTSQITSLNQISKLKDETIENQRIALDDATAWYNTRLFGFTLGVVGTIAVAYAVGAIK